LDIDLSHIEPFVTHFQPRDWHETATVRVIFNNHCFSRAYKPGIDNKTKLLSKAFTNKTEQRVFCHQRHALSYYLPNYIRSLGNKRIASTREGNMVRLETPEHIDYAIFFTLRRLNSRRAEVFVVSAYALNKGQRPADTGEMKFDLALAKVLRGEKPKFP